AYANIALQPATPYKLRIGIESGYATLEVNDEQIIQQPLYLAQNNWCTSGLLMTFMWGGPAYDPIHWAPKNQSFTVSGVVLNAY
ncbi:MAG: hypothetical protein VW258_12510, partial [Thalassolituus sp.]